MIAIKKIQIYGFGKHENVTIQLQDGVTIFYGANEVGKTTIQQFILQILFGFPTKQQTLQKYEPKTSSKFGGQLTIQHPKFGTCTIERVKGKAVGDVTVYLEDGTRGQDELLSKIVNGYSRAAFEAIFSFSIHELQGIEKMSEEELTHLLLASGTTGVNQLTSLEKKLEKEAGELFKKSGKNPAINQKIEQLKNLEKTIKQERTKIDSFEHMLVELEQTETQLNNLYVEQKKLQEDWQQLTILRQAQPLLEQQSTLQHALKDRNQQHFPAEGIRRYEQLKDKLTNENLQLTKLQETYTQLESQLRASGDAAKTDEMLKFIHREVEWNQLLAKELTLTEELFILEQEIEGQFRLLGVQEEVQRQVLLEENVSLQQEQQFQQQLLQLNDAEDKLQFHTRSQEQISEELTNIVTRQQQLAYDSLTKEEEQMVTEWPRKKQRLEHVRLVLQTPKQQKQPMFFVFLSIFVSLIAVIFGVLKQNWAVTAVGLVMAIFLVLFLKNIMRNNAVPSGQRSQTQRELIELERFENIVQTLIEKQRRSQERTYVLEEQQRDKERNFEKLEREIQQLEQQIWTAETALQQFLHRFHIEGHVSKKLLPELFARIRTVQELAISMDSKKQLLQDTSRKKREMMQQIEDLLHQEYNEQELFIHLRTTYNDYQKLQHEEQHIIDNCQVIQNQLAEKHPILENLHQQIAQLFSEAKVEQEATFYEAFKRYNYEENLAQQLEMVSSQLAAIGEVNMPRQLSQNDLQARQEELEMQQSKLQLEIDQLIEQRASLQLQKEYLLTDEKYGELLQTFEDEKAALLQIVLNWSTKKAVTVSIHQTLHRLREQKLPYVLTLVNEFFTRLTDGRYDKLLLNDNGIFEAQSAAGLRYHVAELSQATKEQAYIALRMALAKTLIESAPFPFIMDDPFVHFDRNRTSNMVQLMKEVGYERQILYFTCHDAMLADWQQKQIVDVGALANERGVISL